jgi:hypothetical protein
MGHFFAWLIVLAMIDVLIVVAYDFTSVDRIVVFVILISSLQFSVEKLDTK